MNFRPFIIGLFFIFSLMPLVKANDLIERRVDLHKYYFSMSIMEYNDKDKSYQIILNNFWDDLERALSIEEKRKVSVDSPYFETALKRYVQKNFIIFDKNNSPVPMSWIGFEIDKDTVLSYFEFKTEAKEIKIHNSVLINDIPQQKNITNFIRKKKQDKQTETFIFYQGKVTSNMIFR